MAAPSPTPPDPRDALIERLQAQIERQQAQIERQQRIIEEQAARIEELLRASKRQAAPFSKGTPKPDPKPPGRRPGPDYGAKAHRYAPETIDEVLVAPLPERCPHCGGTHLVQTATAEQFQVELPRKPIHRRFDIALGHCATCDKRLQGRHPLQTSDALGAAASQLGPDLQAFIVWLNKRGGLSHGKIVALLETTFGIPLSRGGSAQAMLRAARRCEPAVNEIRLAVRQSGEVVPDETGWRVEGKPAWLHVMATPTATLFVIRLDRSGQALREVLGEDFVGALVHDGLSVYDSFECLHQQCLTHLLRRCKELLEEAVAGAVRFPRQVKALLQEGLDVRDRRDAGELGLEESLDEGARLLQEMEELVARPRQNEENGKLSRFLRRHLDALFTFLLCTDVDAANYRAEQALKVPIVNRKVWGGSRTWAGARAHAALCSVLATAQQEATEGQEYIAKVLCTHPNQAPPRLLPHLQSKASP